MKSSYRNSIGKGSGQAMAEFVVVLLPFYLLIFGAIQTAMIFSAKTTLNYATFQAARMGAGIATLPPSVLRQLYKHPLTEAGLEAFLSDWEKTGQSILED